MFFIDRAFIQTKLIPPFFRKFRSLCSFKLGTVNLVFKNRAIDFF